MRNLYATGTFYAPTEMNFAAVLVAVSRAIRRVLWLLFKSYNKMSFTGNQIPLISHPAPRFSSVSVCLSYHPSSQLPDQTGQLGTAVGRGREPRDSISYFTGQTEGHASSVVASNALIIAG